MTQNSSFAIRSKNIYTLTKPPFDGYLVIKNGKVEDMVEDLDATRPVDEVYDVGSARVFPGFIDLHVHGSGGWDVPSADVNQIHALSRYLAAFGTTAYYPTIGAAPKDVLQMTIAAVRDATQNNVVGAEVLGLHMEGPFLNRAKKGAMIEQQLLDASWPLMQEWLRESQGTIKRVTIAPECGDAMNVIRRLVETGVAVGGGHTAATYDETIAAIDGGVHIANHTYNAMQGLNHREPGALGAYLTDDRVFCELIADKIHVHEAAIKLASRVAGRDRVCLITDAVMAAGMPPGIYSLNGRRTTVTAEGRSTLSNGTIAGSMVTMLQDVRNYADITKSLEESLIAASLNPARAMGIDDRKGSLGVGRDADLVIVDDTWTVIRTLVRGETVYDGRNTSPTDLLNAEIQPEGRL